MIRILLAAFIFLTTIEAFYWPLLPKPGTKLDWWQSRPLANIGYIVGSPVLFLHFVFTRYISGAWSDVLGWALSIAYAFLIFFMASYLHRRFRVHKRPNS